MAPSILSTLTSGVIFGAALAASGVYSPAVIIGQLRCSNFYMLEVFLLATAGSSIVMSIARNSGYAPCAPRKANEFGFHLGGNVLGGLMQGVGMALSGACAGTVLVQAATGVPSGLNVLAGAGLGGIAFAKLGYLFQSKTTPRSPENLTLQDSLGVKDVYAIASFNVACGSIVYLVSRYSPVIGAMDPVLAGGLIAGAQTASILLTTNTLGTSTAYQQFGQYFWAFLDTFSGFKDQARLAHGAIVFALGIMGGAAALKQVSGVNLDSGAVSVSFGRAVLGGFLLAFGSRISGGCTSGHGISGMATLSWSSFLTVACMFGGGMIGALFLY